MYPGPRNVAYSSIAFHLLKGYLEDLSVGVRRFFLEDTIRGESRGRAAPGDSMIILVSLPYELMYADLVKILDYAGIPVYRRERGPGDPVVVVGGPAVTANPAPILPLVDAVLVGEAEPVLDVIAEASQAGSRSEALDILADAPGMLVPGHSSVPVERVFVRDLDTAWYPVRQDIPGDVEPVWGRSFMLETTRGCARGCRFCMEGSIFRPMRSRSPKRAVALMIEGVKANKVGRVSFYSLSFFDSKTGDTVLEAAVSEGLEVSVPSLRADTLTPERARLIAEGGQRSITIAPETGSCRIAKAIHKPICKGGAVEAVEMVVDAGITGVKMYIMTAFPGESEEDLAETISMIEESARLLRGKGRLKVSINPFIPKPATSMQWLGLADRKTIRSKVERIAKAARRHGAQVFTYDARLAEIQAVLSRGDSRLAPLIVEWARRGGGLGAWRAAQKATGIDIRFYLEPWSPDYTPEWHRLVEHPGSPLRLLRREYEIYASIAGGGLRIPG
ncbi:MAG: radical SAM protein [Desulfurococcales archaeon]|nr:radical SAM protein [Desulfurococcales archaeon]